MADKPILQVIKPKRACEILAEYGWTLTEATLDAGLRQGVFPFGIAIERKGQTYYIFEALLRKWIAERLVHEKEKEKDES